MAIYMWRGQTYNYSYDFRNKTTTNLTNDWWLNVSSLTTGSSGIMASSWTAVNKNVSWLSSIMNTAKKLTLELQTVITNVDNSTSWLLLMEDLNYSKQCWFYYDTIYFDVAINSADVYRVWHNKANWNKTITCEYDFVNKTYSGNYVWGNGTFSGTLTDAQIAWARNLGYIYMPIEWGSYIQTINITVEY